MALIPPGGVADSFNEALIPREYCVGRTAWLFGDKKKAKSALMAARAIFERTTKQQPDYSQAWSYLGLTDAMLGRRDDAIREGKRACEVLPFSKDSSFRQRRNRMFRQNSVVEGPATGGEPDGEAR